MRDGFLSIEHDVFFISQRLREIDDEYRLVYNVDKKCYEVHTDKGQFCFRVRDDLDARTIDYARKTRVERQEKIIEEMDRENEKLRKQQINDAVEKLAEVLL